MTGRRATLLAAGAVVTIALLALTVWLAVTGVRQVVAAVTFSVAVQQQRDALADYQPIADRLDGELAGADDDLELANQVADLAAGVVTQASLTALSDASSALTAARTDAAAYGETFEAPVLPDYWAGTLESAAAQVREGTDWYRTATEDAPLLTDELASDREALADAGEALFASAAEVEPQLEAASWVAPVNTKLAARHALAEVVTAPFEPGSLELLQTYVDAAAALPAAHAAELATFDGPLYDNRVDALAFANSISGGVLLEIDWVPELFGFGGDHGMAGQASLEQDGDTFYSRITLTDSVAARWGDGDAEAITAHEVGHAITLKCSDIFNASANGDYEAFATAWAIGQGWTSVSNGTAAYGRPSDDLIAAAMACR